MPVTARGKRRRGAAVVLAMLLAAVPVAAMLAVVVQAAPAGFLHLRHNLSVTDDRTSQYPDLAVSPDRNWVVAVWVEGHSAIADDRGHVYLRAASESGGSWGNRVTVYSGGSSACAYNRAAVVVTGSTAHVAYVVYDSDCGDPDYSRVRYRTCSLTSGQCGASEEPIATATDDYLITWVDLTLDEDGNPRLVFARYEGEPLTGKILYKAKSGGGWLPDEEVWGTGDNNTPTIAWGHGCAHVAWENATDSRIWYRRRCAGGWDSEQSMYNSAAYPPNKPDVAAGGEGQVFVVWDFRRYTIPDTTYNLVYRRSNVSGTSFLSYREVGTDETDSSYFTEYKAAGTGYLDYLRPSIAVNDDGWPAVVWHTGSSTAGTYYTYAISGTTGTSVEWYTPTVLVEGDAGAALVSMGEPITDDVQLLHVAYMEVSGSEWDVYYDSNQTYDFGASPVCLPLVLNGS